MITGPADREGDITPVSDEVVELFKTREHDLRLPTEWQYPEHDMREPQVIVQEWEFDQEINRDFGRDMGL